jgi:7-carboxy-7-deazaguanine synthase
MSISPKLSNSIPTDSAGATEHKERCFNADAIRRLMNGYEYQLKFVVDTPADLDEIAGCVEEIKNMNPYKVFLMPQATTRRQLVEKSQMLAEYCLQTGFAMSQRLQVMLWEGQRGK